MPTGVYDRKKKEEKQPDRTREEKPAETEPIKAEHVPTFSVFADQCRWRGNRVCMAISQFCDEKNCAIFPIYCKCMK
jgi:hypothetical protein